MSRAYLLIAVSLAALASCTPIVPEALEQAVEPALTHQHAALQTFTAKVSWNGAWACPTCGGQYACSDNTGNWNAGAQAFADPLPSGWVAMGVQVAVYGRGYDGGTARVLLNGVQLGSYNPPDYPFFEPHCFQCDPAQTVSYTATSTTGVPGYAYGGLNTLQLVTSRTNCVAYAVVTLLAGVPQLQTSVPNLSFGTIQVGTSASQQVTVINSGSAPLVLRSATAAAPFSLVSGALPTTLQPGASLPLTVQFHPTAESPSSGLLALSSNDPSRPLVQLPLQGGGGDSLLSVTPALMDFGRLPVGTASSRQLLLHNSGNLPLTIQSATTEPPFTVISVPTGGTVLQPGGSQVLTVSFTAPAGVASQTLTILSNASSHPVAQIPLTGEGVAPSISVRPSALNFQFQQTGTSSRRVLTVVNEGKAELVVNSITATAPYALEAVGTPLRVAPQQSSEVVVTFQPLDGGSLPGQVMFQSNDQDTPSLSVELRGIGVGPALQVAPAAPLAFGNQEVSTTSPAQTLTLTNTGVAPIVLEPLQAPEGFSVTPTARLVLDARASTVLSVAFDPTTAGSYNRTLALQADGPGGGTVNVNLTGTGVAPRIDVFPRGLTFTAQRVGATSTSQQLTITNAGTEAVTLQSVAVEGPFALATPVPTLPASLTPGGAITFNVNFTPTDAGAVPGKLLFFSTAPTSPAIAKLQGTGIKAVAVLHPQAVDFGGQRLSTTSAPHTLTLTNTGNASLDVTGVTPMGPFTVSGITAGLVVEPQRSLQFQVTFSPTDAGVATGSISIESDATNSPSAVALSGTGTTAALQPQPSMISFDSQRVGTVGHRSALLSNTGTSPILLQAMLLPDGFSVSGLTLPHALAPGAVMSFQVGFKPSRTGAYSGTLLLQHDASSTPLELGVQGTGIAPTVMLAPDAISFGNQRVGLTSPAQTVQLSNTGNAPMRISRVSVAAPFAISGLALPHTVQSGEKVSFQISFTPASLGNAQQVMTITTDASSGPVMLPLSGTGVMSHLVVDPRSLSFDKQRVGTSSAPRTINIANTGGAQQGVVVESTHEAFQLDTSTVATAIPAGGNAPITVVFRPVADGPVTGEVRVLPQGGGGETVVLQVEGTGEAVSVEGNGCTAGGVGGGFLMVLWVLFLARARRRQRP
jgi:hypothetical protein